uniref:Uncharacterized protein n=1 Tax=Arundo donax TaxID=35708 RepID=A0A0A9SF46_ARUDO
MSDPPHNLNSCGLGARWEWDRGSIVSQVIVMVCYGSLALDLVGWAGELWSATVVVRQG